MKIFITSDTHFGHFNSIKYGNRPYSSVEEMDNKLIENWNSVVSNEDYVYHLGDVSLAGIEKVAPILQKLNGVKHLVFGNHDRSEVRKSNDWCNVSKTASTSVYGLDVAMQHKPFQLIEEGKVYLHGHCHGNLGRYHDGQIDVGVDCWEYKPVDLDVIIDFWKLNITKGMS
jgi:calcineurin-like phosphoesterase family protein